MILIISAFLCYKQGELDQEGIFAVPVVEAYPEIEELYLSAIESPMDLRTIDEMRIHEYKDIKELQSDLILMLRNCCTFNAEGSPYWNYGR